MSTERKVLYIGEDAGYLANIEARLAGQFSHLGLTCAKLFKRNPQELQSLLLDISSKMPVILYLDFSKHTKEMLHLARLVRRSNQTKQIVTIGLLDYLATPELIEQVILTGVQISHIKSGEIHDTVFDALTLLVPKDASSHSFAIAKFKDKMQVQMLCKIGALYLEGMHIETNLPVNAGEKIDLFSPISSKFMPSASMTVKKVSTVDLFYPFRNSVELEFVYCNPIPKSADENPKIYEEKVKERESELVMVKRKLKDWLADNSDRSAPRKAKLFIVDKLLTVYNSPTLSDSYSFMIRSQPFLENVKEELEQVHPQVIAFQMGIPDGQNPLFDPALGKANDIKDLHEVVTVVKSWEKKPFIVVFNYKEGDSKSLQDKFGYPLIVSGALPLSMQALVGMVSTFEKKLLDQEREHKKLSKKDEGPTLSVFFKKDAKEGTARIKLAIDFVSISESDALFRCDRDLPLYSILQLENPVPFFLTVVPHTEKTQAEGGKGSYRALINLIGEDNKKLLRQYVNSIFFRQLEEQKKAEKEEQEKLGQAFLTAKSAEDAKSGNGDGEST